jgi:hypothetical protein
MFIHYGPSHGASLHTTNMDTNMDFMGISWDFMGFHGDISKLKPFFAKHWIVPSP